MSAHYEYVGKFSTLDCGGAPLTCYHCKIAWTGCAAAADCPNCGAPKGYGDDDHGRCYCEACRPAAVSL